MYTERRRFQKVILSMLLSLVMAVTMIPGFAFAESAAVPSASAARMQVPQNLEDYTGLQQGTTSVRIYMLNCGELETTYPNVFADANEYTSRWDIKVNPAETSFFDNYIMDTPDPGKEIEFVFSIGGGGMNHLNIEDEFVINGIGDYVKVLNADGEEQERGIDLIFAPHPGSGGGTGGGPSRAVDVIVKIAPNTLNGGETYKLAITSGLHTTTRDALDKDIYFTFTTAPVLVQKVALNQTNVTLDEGKSVELTASVSPEKATDKSVTWTSSNEKVAKVAANGKVTAIRAGSATVKATAKDGSRASASCAVTVEPVFKKLTAKAASNGHKSVKVSWSKDAKADGYTVYRYNRNAKKFRAIKNTKKHSFINRGLTTGKRYTYKVRAYRVLNGKKVYGAYSAKKYAKPIPAATKVTAKVRGSKAVIRWKNVSGADQYILYKSTKKNGGYYKERITVKNRYTDYGLRKGKTYYYKARAYKTVDGKKVYSKYSKVIRVRVK